MAEIDYATISVEQAEDLGRGIRTASMRVSGPAGQEIVTELEKLPAVALRALQVKVEGKRDDIRTEAETRSNNLREFGRLIEKALGIRA